MSMTTINKYFEHAVLKNAESTDEDLAQINLHTTREIEKGELFIFKIAICDNEVDRDIERFTEHCLDEFAELFIGKTVIADHNPKASNQSARIFKTEVIEVQDNMTKANLPLKRLVAHCYMIRTKSNEDLILEIEGGIKKEVSISARVSSFGCSVCGQDRRKSPCEHQKGLYYNGELCFHNLSSAKDAYEVSFVAIPAQRGAGVIKGFELEIQSINEFDGSSELELLKIKAQILSEI